jgi:hypothetical protein
MEFKVIPFNAHIDHKTGSSDHVSLQLEQMINKYSQKGWTYLRMETVTNHIMGSEGCFGLGAKPSITVACNMLVFKKS